MPEQSHTFHIKAGRSILLACVGTAPAQAEFLSDAGQDSRFYGLTRGNTVSSSLPITKAGRADKMERLHFVITAGERFL